jgi:nucleoside-triphosphatase THEP1
MNYDSENDMFRFAADLVNQSSRNIFLTGKAGTGKTTFLRYIRENASKQVAVVAPTGVAAINAGGVTIHSFFQLPLSPFVPETKGFSGNDNESVDRHSLISRLRINKEKIRILQELELLVIDEISMVRCDTMDAIDTVLRHIRKRPYERFGGLQVLFIGDMFQLPPVIKNTEWQVLSEFYNSPYFFDSMVIREEPPVYIEFNKIYRQSEERFIHVLNQVRNNELDEEGMKILNGRYRPAFKRTEEDGYIVLTTHNETARNINGAELAKLNGKELMYRAEIKDEFSENAFPADEVLRLKVGAQVMFIKNDTDRSKRYYNGKIGVVTALENDKILVKCKDEPDEIDVSRDTWENFRYSLNNTTRQMDEQLLGSFSQYPLRLAWAITIHKSQGLTFEKAIIDAGKSFASGQVYVALSRCTSLDGLVLQSEINRHNILTDQRIVEFAKKSASSGQLKEELANARKAYEEKVLLSTFDFRLAIEAAQELKDYLLEEKKSFNAEGAQWIETILENINNIQGIASKFHIWLKSQFQQSASLEENDVLQERMVRAAEHFIKELNSIIVDLQRSPVVTDSKLHAREFNETLKELFSELAIKTHLLQGFTGRFNIDDWHKRKKSFVLPGISVNSYAGASERYTETPHPSLHYRLRKLRESICAKRDLPIYIVAGTKTIDEMARYLPQTLGELRKISGFGDAKVEQYGQQFLDVIIEYSEANGLESLIHEKSPKKEKKEPATPKTKIPKAKTPKAEAKPKVDTREETFKLYKEGMTIPDIANTRERSITTIENHLAYYVSKGVVNVEELISREKIEAIEPVVRELGAARLTSIKEQLGDKVSFGDIRLTIAWLEYQDSLYPEQ